MHLREKGNVGGNMGCRSKGTEDNKDVQQMDMKM